MPSKHSGGEPGLVTEAAVVTEAGLRECLFTHAHGPCARGGGGERALGMETAAELGLRGIELAADRGGVLGSHSRLGAQSLNEASSIFIALLRPASAEDK